MLIKEYYQCARSASGEGDLLYSLQCQIATPGSSEKRKPFRVFPESDSQGTADKYSMQMITLLSFWMNAYLRGKRVQSHSNPSFVTNSSFAELEEFTQLIESDNSDDVSG